MIPILARIFPMGWLETTNKTVRIPHHFREHIHIPSGALPSATGEDESGGCDELHSCGARDELLDVPWFWRGPWRVPESLGWVKRTDGTTIPSGELEE